MNVIKESAIEHAFEFTNDDLNANHEGQLSATQIQRLRGKSINMATIIIVVLGALGVLSYLSAGSDTAGTPVFVLVLVVTALVTVGGTVGWNEFAIRSRTVNKATGTVYLAYGYGVYNPPVENRLGNSRRLMLGRAGAYVMLIENQEFRINREQWNIITPGSIAAAYWVPNIRKIVSIEIIDHNVTLPDDAARHLLNTPNEVLPALPGPMHDQDDQDMPHA